MPNENTIRVLFFILRCSAAGTSSYLAAAALGLPHPNWATLSALIVSQETLGDTTRALVWRLIGSFIGVAMAIAIDWILTPLSADVAMQLAVGLAICAAIARGRPGLRVCMWTFAIVILTRVQPDSVAMTGFFRGAEVVLGALIGFGFHQLTALVVNRLILPRLRRYSGSDR